MKKFFNFLLALFILCSVGIASAKSLSDEISGPKWRTGQLIIYMSSENEESQMMQKAITEWQSKIKNRLGLWYTYKSRDLNLACVEINFTRVEGKDAENEVNVSLKAGSESIRKVYITVKAKYDPIFAEDKEAKEKNDKDLYAKMLHASGTMLGMHDSTDEQSIMFPERKEEQTITSDDIRILANLYRTKPTE